MTRIVIFVCVTCQQYNKQYLGTPGFEMRGITYPESLTDAYQHLIEGHEVRSEIQELSDEND